jgi:hypothetical protein
LEAVEVAEGGTTAAAFFGLSSSLKIKLSDIKEKEKIKKRKKLGEKDRIYLRVK